MDIDLTLDESVPVPDHAECTVCYMSTTDDMAHFKMCCEVPNYSLEEIVDNIEKVLPLSTYKYCICEYDYSTEKENWFSVTLGLNARTEDEAESWFTEFTHKSHTTMRVQNSVACEGPTNLFKRRYRCQHNTRASITSTSKQSSKNRNCPAFMVLTVKRTNHRLRRKNVEHAIEFPTKIRLAFHHSHSIEGEDVLRHRDVSQDTKKKFVDLFEAGLSPSSALETHKYDLLCQHGENYTFKAADRAILPDVQWCYRLFYKIHRAYAAREDEPQVHSSSPVYKQRRTKAEAASIHDETELQHLSTVLDNFKDTIMRKMRTEAREVYRPAVAAFIKSAESLTTDSALISALSTFGKDRYAAGILKKKGKHRQKSGAQRKRVHRKRMATGGGKTDQRGRPLKISHAPEHGYSQRMPDHSLLEVPPKICRPAANNDA